MKYILAFFCLVYITNLSAKILKKQEIYDLLNNNIKLHRNIFYAIAKQESNFNTDAIGDFGASIGLLQLNKSTIRGLYRNGLLNTFKRQIRSLDDALKMRIEPDYNLWVGERIFKHNKQIIIRTAKKYGIKLSKQRLLDLCIISHNLGVSKTIYRRLLNKGKKNPKVDDYLNKIKLYIGEYNE